MNEENTQSTDDDNINAIDDETLVDEIEVEPSEADDEIVDGDKEIDDESSELDDEFLDVDEIDDKSEAIYPSPSRDEMEIDAALAAVSQLNLLTQDRPDDGIVDGDYQEIAEFTRSDDSVEEHRDDFEQPYELSMSRGQLASVIPAFALIILGGWLTFTLTTTETKISTGLLFAIVLIGGGLIFLSQWLTSARWSRGNFFLGTVLILIGGVQLYLTQISPSTLNNGWTLWLVAIGIALVGTGILTIPRLSRLSIMGIITIMMGAVGYILTSDTIEAAVITFISNLWGVGVLILVFMILAPLIRRRQ